MINFVGAGCGAVDLITLRGKRLIEEADIIIYAGSLINTDLLKFNHKKALMYNSALMDLDEIMAIMIKEGKNKRIVRLHSGDPSIYGAIKEQMLILDKYDIPYDICPGVSSLSGAAAALKAEYTPAEVSQTVIICRMEGKTKVPELESLHSLATHQASMVIFLSISLIEKVKEELLIGGYTLKTPVGIVYKATWDDEKVFECCIEDMVEVVKKNNIKKTALICVGNFLKGSKAKSKLYSKDFSTEYRNAK